MDGLSLAIADLNEEEALKLAGEMLEEADPVKILETCREGMRIVGDRFAKGEFFISDLMMAAEIFRKVMEKINPQLKTTLVEPVGRIVIGTVEEDIHDIGKNIVAALLEATGFEVHDLGVDVPPDRFLEAIRKYQPDIVGLSCLLSFAYDSMKRTVEAIKAEGMREKVKIIIGGEPVSEEVCRYVDADAHTRNAAEGVDICRRWIKNGEQEARKTT